MCMAYLSYELSSYNTTKMAVRGGNIRAPGSMHKCAMTKLMKTYSMHYYESIPN